MFVNNEIGISVCDVFLIDIITSIACTTKTLMNVFDIWNTCIGAIFNHATL